jgi:putative spermidine/putrescine transport system permease protein
MSSLEYDIKPPTGDASEPKASLRNNLAAPAAAILRLSWRLGGQIVVGLIVFMIAFPSLFVIYLSFSEKSYFTFPITSFSFKWYEDALSGQFLQSIVASSILALTSSILACIIGTMSAYALNRYRFWGTGFLVNFFLAPLALPQIVLAIGYLILITRIRSVSGINLTGTLPGLLIAHVLVSAPWVIRTVSAVLEQTDRAIEDAAQSLGASPWRTFFAVTLPAIMPGIVGGFVFAFIISFGNFELSLMVSQPSFEPLPIRIYHYLTEKSDPAVAAVSALVVVFVALATWIIDRLIGLQNIL